MPYHHLSDFALQCCHRSHLGKVPGTRTVEGHGRIVMAASRTSAYSAAQLLNFSQQVCSWGGKTGARVFGRIRKAPPASIVAGFSNAIAALTAPRPNLLAAKGALAQIGGLGSFSYASKHLRMLRPDLSPVLDSVVDKFLVKNSPRYANSTIENRFLGYADFCLAKAQRLKAAKVTLGDFIPAGKVEALSTTSNPAHCNWTAADVDMACFAWLQGWCGASLKGKESGSSSPAAQPSEHQGNPPTRTLTGEADGRPASRPTIFLAQDHEKDTAVTLKEECGIRWNNAWICRSHGALDFKIEHARGTTRYLIGEILAQGVDVTADPRWEPSVDGKTCHHGGVGYQGRLHLLSVEESVRYLKDFFIVEACPGNLTQTQAWIDAL